MNKEHLVNPIIKKDGITKFKFNYCNIDEGNPCYECGKKLDMSKPHLSVSIQLETEKEETDTISVEVLDSQCTHIFCDEKCYEKYFGKIADLLEKEVDELDKVKA